MQLKGHRQTAERAMARWRTPALSRTFALWLEYMDVCAAEMAEEAHRLAKEELAAAAAAEREQEQAQTKREVERRLDLCRKTIARMQHIQVNSPHSIIPYECNSADYPIPHE
jgi:hypothetical protein